MRHRAVRPATAKCPLPPSHAAANYVSAANLRQLQENNNENQNQINMERPQDITASANPNFGKTPKYLLKYKEEFKEREREKEEKKAALRRPPGTVLVGEQERIETLESLNAKRKEVLEVLMKLPLSLRTEGLKRQKIELDKTLGQLEKAIETYSRSQVYVKK